MRTNANWIDFVICGALSLTLGVVLMHGVMTAVPEEVADLTITAPAADIPSAEAALQQATSIFLTAEALYLLIPDEVNTQQFAEIIVKYQSIYLQVCPELATPDTCHKAWELLDKYAVKHKEAALPRGVEV